MCAKRQRVDLRGRKTGLRGAASRHSATKDRSRRGELVANTKSIAN